jgi:hypothetical protein
VYRAVFKDRGRAAENEIDVALDVTVFEPLTPAVYKQRVLPPEKAAIAKLSAVRIDEQSHRLRAGSERILKRHVFSAKLIGVNEGTEGESRISRLERTQSIGKNRLERIITAKRDEALARADADLLAIDTRLEVNHDSLTVVFRNVIDRFLDRTKVTRPIRGNNDLSRKRATAGHKKAQEAQRN